MLSRTRRLPLGGLLFLVMAIAVGCGGQEGETAHQAEGAESHAMSSTRWIANCRLHVSLDYFG